MISSSSMFRVRRHFMMDELRSRCGWERPDHRDWNDGKVCIPIKLDCANALFIVIFGAPRVAVASE